MMSFFFSMVLGGIFGYASERLGFTHNGYVPSIIIAMGGTILFFFVGRMFGISFGPPGVNALIASAGALFLIPTEVAYRRRNKRGRR
ncbi:hypothetical protein [Pontivivens insulae]|nr:hypothetical protein [Pontivivens insulae]